MTLQRLKVQTKTLCKLNSSFDIKYFKLFYASDKQERKNYRARASEDPWQNFCPQEKIFSPFSLPP